MDIIAIMKQVASLKEEVNIMVYGHVFERYPPETDFDEVKRISSIDQSTFAKEGYITREYFSGQSEEVLHEVIDGMISSYESIIQRAYELSNVLR